MTSPTSWGWWPRHWNWRATPSRAANGAAALAMARADPPALVVLDVMLPGLDGHGVVAALTTDPATAAIPVLMRTSRRGWPGGARRRRPRP